MYTHLTLEEREEIAIGLTSGLSKRAIARLLNRNPSTISRECLRNQPSLNQVRYRANCAHTRSQNRSKKSHARERLKSQVTRDYVSKHLILGWTPEIISGRIRQHEKNIPCTNYESIYQWIYSEQRDLIKYLARSHRKRKKRGSSLHKHASKIPNRTPIEHRPVSANTRYEFGHWEVDSAVSRQSKAAIAVLVERGSRLVKIRLLPSKSALHMHQAIIHSLATIPAHLRQSITYDNGTENCAHQETNAVLNTRSFFCNPYHSWEKGSVEHVIGLIRRFYPKKTDWRLLSHSDLSKIEYQLNQRPRKCLGFKSPAEVFGVALAA